MTSYDFDMLVERRGTGSAKWEFFDADVLPMWVADMDFPSPTVIVDAIRERAAHGFFGYDFAYAELREVLVAAMQQRYNWHVQPEEFVFIPSLVTGINAVCRAVAEPGAGVITQTPVYPPFLSAPPHHAMRTITVPLPLVSEERSISYDIDFAAFEAGIDPSTRLFLLCHPHNPTGVAYSRKQLERYAEICARHDVVICSDEIHCDLMLNGQQHTPIASLSPDIAARTITLMAPSKTYNLPGLKSGFAIVQNPDLRRRLEQACEGIVPHINIFGMLAAKLAYSQCDDWHQALIAYLIANRDAMVGYIEREMPQIRTTVPEATYLAWFDCRETGIEGNPYTFFLEHARVALGDGATFGPGGEGFVRLNFACPRSMLMEALERMKNALRQA
ncbi:MAG TPA: PatB family C-S lyase [Roseiflexaceae bacterium]|nr:PatB family C-S lyase [Roseiflexaceae bacterium]HMP40930.1 PatB family C-S lyase [Roseiflexaceae bacterium]